MSPSRAAPLTLEQVAERLGVHYMTVYRYVRTGRLAGHQDGTHWQVEPADLEDFLARRRADPPARHGEARPRRRADYTNRLVSRLVVGDEVGSWDVVESALGSGLGVDDLYLDVLAPALAAIGDGWRHGTISVGQEHQAAAVVQRLIGRLGPRFARRGRKRGTVVLGAPAGDPHALPSAMFADLLRGEGFGVIDLGGNTPPESFAGAAATADKLIAVGISVTGPLDDAAVRAAIDAVRSDVATTVLVGGGGATQADAERLGADLWGGTGRDAVDRINRVADESRPQRRRPSRKEP